MANQADIKKILIFTGGGIGDIIMSIPALRSFGECFKGKEIDIAVSSRVRDVIENIIEWHEVIVWDKGLVKKTITRSLLTNYDLYLNLRKRKYDLIIDMEAIETNQAALKRFLFYTFINPLGIAGRNTDGRGFFLNFKTNEFLLSKEHEVDRRLAVVEAIECKVRDKDIGLKIEGHYRKIAKKILDDNGIASSDFFVGINPNAYRPTRLWDANKFVLLAKKIHSYYGAKIGIIGGKGDSAVVKRIIHEIGENVCFELIGLNLMTLAAVVSKMNFFVTNDTGPMHIAAAVKTPVVAIFGPENPFRYQPYMPEELKRVIFINNVECRPCTHFTCDKMVCLEQISVDMVWEAFKSLANDLKNTRYDGSGDA